MVAPNATLDLNRPEDSPAGPARRRRASGRTAPPDEATKARIYGQHRRGVGAEVLADEHGLTRAGVTRVINEVRARRLLDVALEAMPNPSFDDPAQHAEILGPLPVPEGGEPARRARVPEGLPPYLADLYDVPLLGREQEMHLFRKMNFLKYRANRLRAGIDPARARAADLDEIERLQGEALAVKNQIIRANLRLVVSIAKKYVGPADNLFELVSDGNMSLIRAVEKFDYARGNKFSTYASWAIMKNFARSFREENRRRDRFVTGLEKAFEDAADTRADEHEAAVDSGGGREAIRGLLGRLDDRERRILVSRFGLDDTGGRTLEQVGRELGITKERVRQLESRARDKLRRIADEEELDLLAS